MQSGLSYLHGKSGSSSTIYNLAVLVFGGGIELYGMNLYSSFQLKHAMDDYCCWENVFELMER